MNLLNCFFFLWFPVRICSAATISVRRVIKFVAKCCRVASTNAHLSVTWVSAIRAVKNRPLSVGMVF